MKMDYDPQEELDGTDIAVAEHQFEDFQERTSVSIADHDDAVSMGFPCPANRVHTRWTKRLKVGEHVSFVAEGVSGSGTIDAVMPDRSVIWIWSDGGLGRRMLHRGKGTSINADRPQLETT